MKRVIKIILILLAIFLITLGVIWLIGRHTAEKNGTTPLSFRQFLGLGTKTSPGNTIPGEGSSTFTGTGGQSGTNGNGGVGPNTGLPGLNNPSLGNPQVSQFTNNGLSVGAAGNLNGNSGTGIDTTGNTGNGSINTTAAGDANSAPACSDADTNIAFTPEEVAELNDLQNQFYTIAQTIHTDADVQTEVDNHDAFVIKADQVTELYNYCEEQVPYVTQVNPRFKEVPTPFWQSWGNSVPAVVAAQWGSSSSIDPAQDSISLLDFTPNSSLPVAHMAQVHDDPSHQVDPNVPDTSGIKGPFGALNFSSPNAVPVNGSILKPTLSNFNLFNGKVGATTNPSDYDLLIPVVEKILRINLW